jgi:hypothetical protein
MFDRPIVFHREFLVVTKSTSAAIFLSQACFWSNRSPDGWFFKTIPDWESEIGLSRRKIDNARSNLLSLKVLHEKRCGPRGKLHYRVDFDRLVELVRMSEQAVNSVQKSHSSSVQKSHSIIGDVLVGDKDAMYNGMYPDAAVVAPEDTASVGSEPEDVTPESPAGAVNGAVACRMMESYNRAKGGAGSVPRAIRAIRRLGGRYTIGQVMEGFERYLACTEPKFISFEAFVANAGQYIVKPLDITSGGGITTDDEFLRMMKGEMK